MNKSNADAAYKEAAAKVQGLVNDLQQHLTAHGLKHDANPKDWGFVGDMNHYAELLEELLGRRG